jgi:hypothetical protein
MRLDADNDGGSVRLSLLNEERARVPTELTHAVCTPAHQSWKPVWIPIHPRADMLITLMPGAVDEAAAARVWRFLRAPHPGHGQLGPYARADTPVPLAAYVPRSGVIVLSTRLVVGELKEVARVTRRGWCARFPDGLRHAATPSGAAVALRTLGDGPGPLGAAIAGVAAVLMTMAAVATSPTPNRRLPPQTSSQAMERATVQPERSGPPRHATPRTPATGSPRPEVQFPTLPPPQRLLRHPISSTVGHHPVRSLGARDEVGDLRTAAGLSPDQLERESGGAWRPGTIRDALRSGLVANPG